MILALVVAALTLFHLGTGSPSALSIAHAQVIALDSGDKPCTSSDDGHHHSEACTAVSGCGVCIPVAQPAGLVPPVLKAVAPEAAAAHAYRVLFPQFRPPRPRVRA